MHAAVFGHLPTGPEHSTIAGPALGPILSRSPDEYYREESHMAQVWEHKVQTYKLQWKGFKYDQIEQDLNDLGKQGWKVVGTLAPSFGSGQAIEVAIILRRPADAADA